MEELKKLRGYLISRFLISIVLIISAEYAVLVLLRHTLIPFVMENYFFGADIKNANIFVIPAGMLLTLLILILELVRNILPNQSAFIIDSFITSLRVTVVRLFMGSGKEINLTAKDELILLVFLLAMLILILLPSAIGAVYYTTIVLKRLRRLEAAERRKLDEYNQRRNLMLSDIAHDLRTPITTVSGYAKALADGMVPKERVPEYLDSIQKKSERMNELISLLFDYVKLDSDGFKLAKEKSDICELLRETAAVLYQDVEDKGDTFDIDIPEEVIVLELDRMQFSRVISNLITNAVKHNESGTEIGLFLRNREDEDIRIIVADTGEMIPDDKKDTIFDPFVMGDESRQSKGGSGLGLSIARKVVEMHGYKIRLVQGTDVKKLGVKTEDGTEFTKAFEIRIPQ
ncbi:MAG: HAMP domain-containing histidine kinase [Eubacterium sp.]|nr:HAMP domain-containing histidine kinase [Eubacterium sp.]